MTTPRYECFCLRQYLSYCSTWQHIKKYHPDFLKVNKHFTTTNIVNTVDPVFGFKIKKITKERIKGSKNQTIPPHFNLSKDTLQKIRRKSPEIQNLLRDLQKAEVERG